MILLTARKSAAASIYSVCAFFADMQRRAEKAKTLNSKQESARIPRHVKMRRDKKDAEASKIVTSPYKRTAEAIFGGIKMHKSEYSSRRIADNVYKISFFAPYLLQSVNIYVMIIQRNE